MKKFYANFKSVVAAVVLASMTLAASCSYDDTGVVNQLQQIQADLAALTERVAALEKRLGDEVAALTELINGKVVVTAVEKVGDATKVTLSDGSSFTVYPECTVVDTDTDTDTNVYITVQKDNDGVLYFAVYENDAFKEWLLVDGAKVPVYDGNNYEDNECDNPYEAVAPMFRVEGENIEVSIDGGLTWVNSGLTAAAAGAQIFAGVEVNNGFATFTLADGSTFDVVIAEVIEFNTTRGQIYVKPGETIEITFTINDAVADVNVMNQPLGWKATIEPKVADEEAGEGDENVDPGMGIMAAGGTEFLLKVTGPSQDFINAGYAEKEGVISVHFNSENGACKVGKIAVELASILLDVDKAGNITITNTWVDTYTVDSWEGSYDVSEFNNYFVTIMPLEYYQEDLASLYNPSMWEWTVDCASGWINNFFYNANEEYNTYDKATYQEGVNEKWIFKATVEEVLDAIDWYGVCPYEGNSFAIIVTPTNPHNYSSLMIEQSQVAFFKQLNVNVECIDTAWNAAYFNTTLRGGLAYHVNINEKAELQRQIDNGWYDGFEGYYSDYIFYWQEYGSQFGMYTIYTDLKEQNIEFSEWLNWGEEYPYAYELSPNTEYIVAILVEEDGKTEYSYDDLKIVEFTTEDITPAATPFEYAIERDDENCTYFKISANVTVPETTVAAYSVWVNEAFQDEDAAIKDYLIKNGWNKSNFEDGYTYNLNTSTNNPGHVKYLYLLIVDAEGNYSIGYQELKSNEVAYNENVEVTIESVEFFTEGKVADITVGGLEGVEFTNIKAYVFPKGGNSYYERDEEELQGLAYSDDWLYKSYTANPFSVTQTADYKYVAVEGTTYFIAVAVNFADGTISNTVCGEFTFGTPAPEPEPGAADYEFAFTAVENLGEGSEYYCDSFYTFKFTNDAGQWLKLAVVTSALVDGALPVGDFEITWDGKNGIYGNATTICKEAFTGMSYDPYITAGNVVISKDGDVYNVVVNGKDMYINGVSGKTLKATFEGTIAAIGGGDNGGDNVGEGEAVELVSAKATAAGDSYIGGTGYNLTFADANGNEIVYMVQTTGNNYLKEGNWNGNYSWSEEGYINTVTWYNVNTAWPYEMTVAVVDGEYDITLEIVDYYAEGQPTLTARYVGQIEGFVLPGAGDDNGDEAASFENWVFTASASSFLANSTLTFTDGTHTVTCKFNQLAETIVAGDTTGFSYAYDFTVNGVAVELEKVSGNIKLNMTDYTITLDLVIDGVKYSGTSTNTLA